MYIILVVDIYSSVNIKPSLYTHIIGFPYHINSKSSNNDDNGNQEIDRVFSSAVTFCAPRFFKLDQICEFRESIGEL